MLTYRLHYEGTRTGNVGYRRGIADQSTSHLGLLKRTFFRCDWRPCFASNPSVFNLKSTFGAFAETMPSQRWQGLNCFIYCILLFSNRSLKKGIRGSHWGVIMDKSNHVIFAWALLWQQHSLVMCPLRFDWTNSFHLMVLSVSVKCVYKWKSIVAPPGESICSSFVSVNCDESSKSCFCGSKTPRIVCIYNPRSFSPRIWFVSSSPVRHHTEVGDLKGPIRLQVVAGTSPGFILPTAKHTCELCTRIHISNFTRSVPSRNKIRQGSGLAGLGRSCSKSQRCKELQKKTPENSI